MSARSLRDRLALIAATGGVPVSATDAPSAIVDSIVAERVHPDEQFSYLCLAVLDGTIPEAETVVRFRRTWASQGLRVALEAEVRRVRRRIRTRGVRVTDRVTVDVTDTASSSFTTGIQRVARESLARWPLAEIELVVWHRGHLIAATPEQRAKAAPNATGGSFASGASDVDIIVPYGGVFVLPEIAVNDDRANRIRSLVQFSGCRSLAIGFDCIPMTTAEMVSPAMPGAFANYLATLAQFDDVVAISESSAREFEGWRRMLSGAGLSGPRIDVLALPFAAGHVDAQTEAAVRQRLGIARGREVVLSVGSHEPRKNHATMLEAAEFVWRRGHEFTVVLVGGNSWDTAVFDDLVERLRGEGRQIITPSAVDDDTVWALYQTARLSVFCSFNEGFGLPVAESLAAGTPVITSDFGSMSALAEGYGGVLVDPRNAESLADAIENLLVDDKAIGRLAGEMDALPRSSWAEYADSLWHRVRELSDNDT